MKKYFYLALVCFLSAGMFMACDPTNTPDNPGGGDEDNPTAGTNGEYCWKVTTTIPMEGTDDYVEVEYTWDTEENIIDYVTTMNEMGKESGMTWKYEKSTAKDKKECQELDDEQGGGNIDDVRDYKERYKKTEPGIYMNGNTLLAKGTDGSLFYIPDVTSYQQPLEVAPEAIPAQWVGWDGKSSLFHFELHYYNDNDGNWMTHTYQDTILYCMEDKWGGEFKDDAIAGESGIMQFMFFKDFQKVADAGDFEETFVEIAKRYQKCGPIMKPSEMIRHYTEHYLGNWLSDWYPADMEATGYVFKYTGSGTIIEMGVQRIFQWGEPRDHWNWIPWSVTDDVTAVTVTINNVSEADATAFINKVKAEGHYTRVTSDVANEVIIGFAADSYNYYDDDVHGPAPEGLNGWVYPSYEVSYIDGRLTIEFYVVKTAFV